MAHLEKHCCPIAWAISLMMIRNRRRKADQFPYGHVEKEGILFNKYLALPVYIDYYQGKKYTRDTRTKREKERQRLFVRRSSSSSQVGSINNSLQCRVLRSLTAVVSLVQFGRRRWPRLTRFYTAVYDIWAHVCLASLFLIDHGKWRFPLIFCAIDSLSRSYWFCLLFAQSAILLKVGIDRMLRRSD